jgi:hypothetical protein
MNATSTEYRDYLKAIQGLDESEPIIPVDPALLLDLVHEPLLAQLIFNPFGPTLQTLSTAGIDEPGAPGLMIRRSFNPHSQTEQIPIAIVYGDGLERTRQEVDVLAGFFAVNGVGKRVSSTPFVTAAPTALLLGWKAKAGGEWFQQMYLQALQLADVDLERPIRRYWRHRTDPWASASDDMHEVLRSFGLDADAEHNGEPVANRSIADSFPEWWEIVTDDEMIRATTDSFLTAWVGPNAVLPDAFGFSEAEMLTWLELFLPKPDDASAEEYWDHD